MLEQCVCKAQKNTQKNFATKNRSFHSKPDSSGYTICGAGLAALAKMVFEWIAGLPFLQSTRVPFLIINTSNFKGFYFFTRQDLQSRHIFLNKQCQHLQCDSALVKQRYFYRSHFFELFASTWIDITFRINRLHLLFCSFLPLGVRVFGCKKNIGGSFSHWKCIR